MSINSIKRLNTFLLNSKLKNLRKVNKFARNKLKMSMQLKQIRKDIFFLLCYFCFH